MGETTTTTPPLEIEIPGGISSTLDAAYVRVGGRKTLVEVTSDGLSVKHVEDMHPYAKPEYYSSFHGFLESFSSDEQQAIVEFLKNTRAETARVLTCGGTLSG